MHTSMSLTFLSLEKQTISGLGKIVWETTQPCGGCVCACRRLSQGEDRWSEDRVKRLRKVLRTVLTMVYSASSTTRTSRGPTEPQCCFVYVFFKHDFSPGQ